MAKLLVSTQNIGKFFSGKSDKSKIKKTWRYRLGKFPASFSPKLPWKRFPNNGYYLLSPKKVARVGFTYW